MVDKEKVNSLNRNSKMKSYMVIVFSFVILAVLLFVGGYNYNKLAKSIGEEAGQKAGNIVGIAVGSWKGITEGIPKGLEEGKKEGLSAKDTEVDIKGEVRAIGKLEVLNADVTLHNLQEIGKAYKGLYAYCADAVFTIDLSESEITYNPSDNYVKIVLPEPELKLYLDHDSSKVFAEYQKFSFTVDAEDAFEAYINSLGKMVEKAEISISNYDTLIQMSRDSGKLQVEQLVRTICKKGIDVEVKYEEEIE